MAELVRMLELSDQEFKTTKITMLRALMEKAGNMQEQMCNVREMEILKENQKEISHQNTTTQVNSAHHRLHTTKEKISEPESMSTETPKTERQRKRDGKRKHIYIHKNCWASLVAQVVKNPPAMQETWVQSLGWEDGLEKGMATHSSILACRTPMDRGAW